MWLAQVVLLWSSSALALPVECDPVAAATLLADARIEEDRAPVSHAELLPGLALASPRTDDALRAALTELCTGGIELSLARGDLFEGPDWAAHSFLLSRTQMRGCALRTTSIAISVVVGTDTAPQYRLRSQPPVSETPVGSCGTPAVWREERTIAGGEGQVRVVLAEDIEDDELASAQVLVRRATRLGWVEQLLLDPAPARLTSNGRGPLISITERSDDKWVVAHANRTGAPPEC